MGLELGIGIIIAIIIIAFFCEYIDSTLGMGYGTTMTPLLMIFGFSPLQIVPAVLLAELFTGLISSFFHHKEGNVDFTPKTTNLSIIMDNLNSIGVVQSFRKGIPLHLKVALLLVTSSIIGASIAIYIAHKIPKFWIQLYIGILVIIMGITILSCLNKTFNFSWFKISVLGMVASFNKGLTGGGYGPIIVSGQVLSGIETKNAVGITSLAEGLTCIIGVFLYMTTYNAEIDWKLAPIIISGAILSTPFSARSVKKIDPKRLKLLVGILTILLGVFTTVKVLKSLK